MKLTSILLLISFYLFSCKNDETQANLIAFGKCSETILTDSLSITQQLIGTWKWTDQFCPCCPNSKPTKADKGVTATFDSNGSYSVTEESATIALGEWEVTKTTNGFFVSFNGQNVSGYLEGYITICGDQLAADQTPVDGCKNLFVKID